MCVCDASIAFCNWQLVVLYRINKYVLLNFRSIHLTGFELRVGGLRETSLIEWFETVDEKTVSINHLTFRSAVRRIVVGLDFL